MSDERGGNVWLHVFDGIKNADQLEELRARVRLLQDQNERLQAEQSAREQRARVDGATRYTEPAWWPQALEWARRSNVVHWNEEAQEPSLERPDDFGELRLGKLRIPVFADDLLSLELLLATVEKWRARAESLAGLRP